MEKQEPKKFRVTICCEEEIQKVLELIKSKSGDKNIIGKLSHALFKEKLFLFLDEIDCDLSVIDRDIKHLLTRTQSGIYARQFQQTLQLNLNGGKNEEN